MDGLTKLRWWPIPAESDAGACPWARCLEPGAAPENAGRAAASGGGDVPPFCQLIDLGSITIANVHLSHGQILNRRQLRRIAKVLPHRAAVVGDYNLIGPALLPGFRDVGPREPTHVAGDVVPLRIDRCLIRGVACLEAKALLREASDHRPIVVSLATMAHTQVAETVSHIHWRLSPESIPLFRRPAFSMA